MTNLSAAVVAVTGTTHPRDVAAPVAASRAAEVTAGERGTPAAPIRDTTRRSHAGSVETSA